MKRVNLVCLLLLALAAPAPAQVGRRDGSREKALEALDADGIALLSIRWDSDGEFFTRFRDVPLGGAAER